MPAGRGGTAAQSWGGSGGAPAWSGHPDGHRCTLRASSPSPFDRLSPRPPQTRAKARPGGQRARSLSSSAARGGGPGGGCCGAEGTQRAHSPEKTPAMTWWGKWAAMKTRDRQTQTWTAQKPVQSAVHKTLQGAEGLRQHRGGRLLLPSGTPETCQYGIRCLPFIFGAAPARPPVWAHSLPVLQRLRLPLARHDGEQGGHHHVVHACCAHGVAGGAPWVRRKPPVRPPWEQAVPWGSHTAGSWHRAPIPRWVPEQHEEHDCPVRQSGQGRGQRPPSKARAEATRSPRPAATTDKKIPTGLQWGRVSPFPVELLPARG